MLYGLDVTDAADPEETLTSSYATAAELEERVPEVWSSVEERVHGTRGELASIDAIIQEVSPRWRLERMAAIDRNILRLGTWEIFHSDVLPVISIDACVDLAKEYGERSSPAFVNGLLDQICRDHDVTITEE
jgi:N utilization substance protein B